METNDNTAPEPMETTENSVPEPQPTPNEQPTGDKGKLEFLFDVPLKVSVEVGRSKMMVKDLLQMREGYVIELDKMAGEPLDLYVNQRLIARGEAVLVNEKFGLRLTEVVSPSERIQKLG